MEDDFIGELEGGVAPEEDTSRNAYGASPVFGLDPVHEVGVRGGGRATTVVQGGGGRENRGCSASDGGRSMVLSVPRWFMRFAICEEVAHF